jgi:hypothetical protein
MCLNPSARFWDNLSACESSWRFIDEELEGGRHKKQKDRTNLQ